MIGTTFILRPQWTERIADTSTGARKEKKSKSQDVDEVQGDTKGMGSRKRKRGDVESV